MKTSQTTNNIELANIKSHNAMHDQIANALKIHQLETHAFDANENLCEISSVLYNDNNHDITHTFMYNAITKSLYSINENAIFVDGTIINENSKTLITIESLLQIIKNF